MILYIGASLYTPYFERFGSLGISHNNLEDEAAHETANTLILAYLHTHIAH